MKALVVLSGGMDSAVALAKTACFNTQVEAVHFQYGSKHNGRELPAARSLARYYNTKLTVIRLPFVGNLFKSDLLNSGGEIPEGHYEDLSMKRTVVPFRNGIMLSIAAGLAESVGAKTVVLGNHAGDHAIYPDCRNDFVSAMSKAIGLGTYAQIKLKCPFVSMSKADIAKLGDEYLVPFDLTWSCYKGGKKHCGKCGTCVERIEAFHLAGVEDPVEYLK